MSVECVTCGKEYSDKNGLRSYHYNEHPDHAPDDWEECPECGNIYESLSAHWSLSGCERVDEQTFACVTCGEEYSHKNALQQLHYNEYPDHTPDDWEECTDCGNMYKSIRHHWASSECERYDVTIACVTCGKEYSSMDSLRNNHYEKYPDHYPDDWEECPECGKRYENISDHWGSLPSHRPDSKNIFSCVTCGKTYSSKDGLRSYHYNENPDHAPDDWEECPGCGKMYETISLHWAKKPNHRPSEQDMFSCVTCGEIYMDKSTLQHNHYRKNPEHTPEDWVECPECNRSFENIGCHWGHEPEHQPELTQEQYETSVGLLMGDGCIVGDEESSHLEVNMISKKYLEHLDELFGIFSNGVSLERTGEESVKDHINRGIISNANEANHNNIYNFRTVRHPTFAKLRKWYSSGSKVWPEDINLTPTVLRCWYVSDGTYRSDIYHHSIQIGSVKESDNVKKVKNYFSQIDIPEPQVYMRKNNLAIFSWRNEEMKEVFQWMGAPPPGFERKWPDSYCE